MLKKWRKYDGFGSLFLLIHALRYRARARAKKMPFEGVFWRARARARYLDTTTTTTTTTINLRTNNINNNNNNNNNNDNNNNNKKSKNQQHQQQQQQEIEEPTTTTTTTTTTTRILRTTNNNNRGLCPGASPVLRSPSINFLRKVVSGTSIPPQPEKKLGMARGMKQLAQVQDGYNNSCKSLRDEKRTQPTKGP